MLLVTALAQPAGATVLPSFKATALTGETVTEQRLIGQPTVLIVTPSRAAAEETRRWATTLRKNLDPGAVRVRDVLAIDLPFFISERDAIGRARERIPRQFHDQTWLLDEPVLEQALEIPSGSGEAHVLVLNPQGEVVARVAGNPTDARVEEVLTALRQLRTRGN